MVSLAMFGGFYGPSVKVRSTEAVVFLVESAESSGSSFAAFEKGTERTGKGKTRVV